MVRVLGLYIGEYSVQCDSQFEQSTQLGVSCYPADYTDGNG